MRIWGALLEVTEKSAGYFTESRPDAALKPSQLGGERDDIVDPIRTYRRLLKTSQRTVLGAPQRQVMRQAHAGRQFERRLVGRTGNGISQPAAAPDHYSEFERRNSRLDQSSPSRCLPGRRSV